MYTKEQAALACRNTRVSDVTAVISWRAHAKAERARKGLPPLGHRQMVDYCAAKARLSEHETEGVLLTYKHVD